MSIASCCRALLAGFLAAAGLAAAPAFAQSHGPAVAPFSAKDLAPRASMVIPGSAEPATELNVPPPEALAIEAMKRANAASRLKRVEIGIGSETGSLAASRGEALRWTPVAGGVAARWRVTSAGAAALRVGLVGNGMPAGMQLRFTGARDGDTVYGPFDWSAVASADAPYWSPVLEGESALVEVFVPASAAPRKFSLSIEHISHLFVSPSAPSAEWLAKASGPCQVDFVCRAPSDAALASAGRSVARMIFTSSSGGSSLCTGTLLNPADNSFTPYFYSAAHCISTQASASTLTTHWFYETTTCGGSTISSSQVQVPGGATLLYSSHPADAVLLRLNASPPSSAVFSGWDAATLASGTPLTAIHHPRGDPKKVSLGTAAGFDTGTSVIPTATGSFVIVNWNSLATGTTEQGSSGSGIFSTAGEFRFRGGLTGGPSSCSAGPADLYDLYSRLDQVYPSIRNYLEPTTSGCTYTLSPTSASVGAGSSSGSFTVSAGGSCTWSASSDASWLTTSSSGSGSGTVTYSVAANGSTSTRTGTITVGGQRFTVTQSGQAASGGSNVVSNGDFESGSSGWTQTASGGDAIIRSGASSSAHAGSGYAWLGGYNNGTDTLYQDVTVPSGSSSLRFWYRITTAESGSLPWDTMTVSIVSPTSGATLRTLVTLSNVNATSGWTQSSAYDLSAYAGQRVRLRFHAVTDFSNVTDFRVDDVTLTSASAANHTALWWNAAENGWGINVNHQGDIVFATLFTYDASGSPLWLVMSRGDRQGTSDTYSGALYRTSGPAFNASPFTPITGANLTQVGTMTLAFAGESATLTYSVSGATVTKTITKQVYGARAAICQGTSSSRASATNYQDLWWNASENGWGINLTHQGDTIFATLFTYAANGQPLWLVMSSGARQSDGSYLGTLYRTTGPVFNAQPFTPIGAGNLTSVGTMRLRFSSGSGATLEYTYQGAGVTKSITRQEFASPLPLCQS